MLAIYALSGLEDYEGFHVVCIEMHPRYEFMLSVLNLTVKVQGISGCNKLYNNQESRFREGLPSTI